MAWAAGSSPAWPDGGHLSSQTMARDLTAAIEHGRSTAQSLFPITCADPNAELPMQQATYSSHTYAR